MKNILIILLLFLVLSCSTQENDDINLIKEIELIDYSYQPNELELFHLINDYRYSIGLNKLNLINHISNKCKEHNEYMIEHHLVNHDEFPIRSQNIINVLGAKKVGENIGYNYDTPTLVLDAWLKSVDHRKTLENDFTDIGLSIVENSINHRKYYTIILIKK